MSNATVKPKLSCEQAYNIWSTEPELIQILDLRSKAEFETGHIPGAQLTSSQQLDVTLANLGTKLAVIVANEKDEPGLAERLQGFDNFVFLSQCHRWSRLTYPLVRVVNGVPEISVEDLQAHLEVARIRKVKLIDVRRPDEFNNELGHIPGAILLTLGPELTAFLENGDRADEIVFICRSGARSGTATADSLTLGYKYTSNLVGGMIRWNEMKYPVERN